MKYKLGVIIFRSNEDDALIAEGPELPGCMAHGSTQKVTLPTAGEAIDLCLMWLEDLVIGLWLPKVTGRWMPENISEKVNFSLNSARTDWLRVRLGRCVVDCFI